MNGYFFNERFDGGFDVGRLHLGEHAKLSFLFCLGYDFRRGLVINV